MLCFTLSLKRNGGSLCRCLSEYQIIQLVKYLTVKWDFFYIVIKSIGKMKYTTKFIYLYSSQKEKQFSTVRFFRDWVYNI